MKNKLAYWLKGGIIGGSLSLFVSLILFFALRYLPENAAQVITLILFMPFLSLVFSFENSLFFNQPGTTNYFFGIIILILAQLIYSILIGAIIGALTGLIIGKIKNSNKIRK